MSSSTSFGFSSGSSICKENPKTNVKDEYGKSHTYHSTKKKSKIDLKQKMSIFNRFYNNLS